MKNLRTFGTVSIVAVTFMLGQAALAKTVVNYWDKWGGIDGEVIQSMVKKFNSSQTQIEVKYTTVDGGSIQQKFLTAMMAGVGPDLVGNWNHRLALYQSAGLVESLDSYLAQLKMSRNSFLPNYWDMMTYNGKVYGMPVIPTVMGLYTNKGVLAESGIDPQALPKTVDDMVMMGDKVAKRDASGRWTRVGFALNDPGYWPYIFPVMFGADLYNEKTDTVDLKQTGLVKSLDWIGQVSAKWGSNVLNQIKAGGWLSASAAFNTGKTAMQIDGSWMALWLAKNSPKVQFNIGALPAGVPSRVGSAWGEADIVFLAKGKHRKEAAQFLMFLMRPDIQREFMSKRETFSAVKGANTPEFIKANRNPSIETLLTLAGSDNLFYAPKTVAWPDLDGIYGTAWWNVWNQKKSPAQAVSEMAKPIDAALKKVSRRKK